MAPRLSLAVVALLGIVALNACSDAPTQLAPASAPALKKAGAPTGDYVILGAGESLPADIADRVAAAGGTVTQLYPEIGVAIARADNAGFAARAAAIAGVESVTEDLLLQLINPDLPVVDFDGVIDVPADSAAIAAAVDVPADSAATAEAIDAPTESAAIVPNNDTFYFLQWAPAAIQAPQAWNEEGYTGSGVRVAILDGGIYGAHPDLAANFDTEFSTSFVPGQPYNADLGTFWHGTHIAGIVGAVDNNIGTIGIAPNATLIAVKVLHGGVGSFYALMAGVMYAAKSKEEGGAGADVINMSLGAYIADTKDKETKKSIKELTKLLDRAMSFAWKRGVTIIAAAGNEGQNLDAEKIAISIPAQSKHVISVSATGPLAWAYGATNFDRPASYTNYGKALVDLAAPGGDFAYPGNEWCRVFRSDGAFVHAPCWVFDMYMSTTRGTDVNGWYGWAAGTSMASPVTAGIAALIIQKAGGDIPPSLVEAELRRGARDLGQPGNDAVYGHGWVNALGSIR